MGWSFRDIVAVVFPIQALANSWAFIKRSRRIDPKAIDNLSGVPDYVATGSAIPVLWGTFRAPFFVAQRAALTVSTTSGTVQTINQATEFKTSGLVLGICQGPIAEILRTWIDRVQVPLSVATTTAVGLSVQLGGLTQPGIQNRKLWRVMVPAVSGQVEQTFLDVYPAGSSVTYSLSWAPNTVLHAYYRAWDEGSGTYSGASGYLPFTVVGNQVTIQRSDLLTPGVNYSLAIQYVGTTPPDVYLQEEGLTLAATSARSFLPDFDGATTITISGAKDSLGNVYDGEYTVASVADKRIVLTNPNAVRPGWPTATGLRKYLGYAGAWCIEYLEVGLELHYPGLAHMRADPLDHKALYAALQVTIPGGTLAAISDAATQTQGWEGEIRSATSGAGPDGLDAAPEAVISDMLTSSLFYGAGLDASRIDLVNGPDGTAASGFTRFCAQSGFSVSLLVGNQKSITELLDQITRACDSIAVDSGGVLKFYPLGERAVGTYAPANRPVYDLDLWDFFPDDGDDPVQVDIAKDASSYNVVPVEFTDRAASYTTQIADIPEMVDVDERGERAASPASLPCIMRRAHAEAISQVMSMRIVNGRAVFTGRLAWNRGMLLEPGDVLRISDRKLGLTLRPVRVMTVDETPDGRYTVTAERYLGAVGTTVYVPA
jgi:hypothetical protein